MKITCQEAAIISNKKEYKEASFKEKLMLRFHLIGCVLCPGFVKKNTQLTRLFRQARLQYLTDEEKDKMRKNLFSH
ncbi:hypothetical protein PP178_13965 [Zeaxanthinibacter sp. PT1]|uniref:hypothetical protein n=1 Tax=Zeaxanthinibacter TaxID=561554 RepID=UPI002349B5C1|nr:hypothetical protein [Zeaxanthinibacter sp. PT1]MDC6352664.1 hypothetical protein [Zeaxanthinibacter sp. PT1]